jgi:nucleoside-diphosphate-sugar epimerase
VERPLPHIGGEYYGVDATVLGASGFIGRWVARALYSQGANLTVVVRHREASERLFRRYGVKARIVACDLDAPDVIPELLDELHPSILFNLAGYGMDHSERDQAAACRMNAGLVEALCDALPDTTNNGWRGQQLVHAGSAQEYGMIEGDLAETSTPNPATFYGKSKLAGTCWLRRHCRQTGMRAVTARLFTVYGPGEHPGRLLPTLLEGVHTRKLLPLTSGTEKRDFTYVEDAVTGLLHLGVSKVTPGEPVNIATGRLTKVREFAQIAASVLGIPRDNLGFNIIESRVQEMDHNPVNIHRLRTLTGWSPQTTIEEGIRRTAEFLATQPREAF